MQDQVNCYKEKTNQDFIDYINKIINHELPSTIEEGYKVAKERDLLLIGKKYKKIHTKCSYYSNSWWIINLFFNW